MRAPDGIEIQPRRDRDAGLVQDLGSEGEAVICVRGGIGIDVERPVGGPALASPASISARLAA